MATTKKNDGEKNLFELCHERPWGRSDEWGGADITLIESALLVGDSTRFELSSLPAEIAVDWRNYRNHVEARVKLHGEEKPFGFIGPQRNTPDGEFAKLPDWKYAQEFAKCLLTAIKDKIESEQR